MTTDSALVQGEETKDERRARKRAAKLMTGQSTLEPVVLPESSKMASTRAGITIDSTSSLPAKNKRKRKGRDGMNGEEGGAGRAASVAVEGQEASKRKTEKKAKTSKQRNGQEPSYVVASGREVGEEKPSTGAEKTVKKKEKQTTEKGAKVETMREESPSRKSKGPIPLLNEVQSMEEETKEKKQKTEKAINGKQKKEMRGKRRTEVDADTSTAGPTVVNGVDPVLANEVDAAKEKDRNGKRKEKAGNETSAVPEAVPTLTLEGISTDASLSDHARNALLYAYQHASSHMLSGFVPPGGGWKFNKARQGWLMRHIWNAEEIPKIYVDLVMGYLKTVQSGARAGLIESAKKHVKAEQLSKVDDNNAEKAIDQEENGIDIGRGDGEKKGEDGEEEELNNETMEVRRGRAEKLLRLLGAR